MSIDPRCLLTRALELGASLAGVASVADLKRAPSFALAERGVELPGGRGGRPGDPAVPQGTPALLPAVVWPEGASSVLMVALAHPAEEPQMDWWSGRNDPPGNRALAAIVTGLRDWLATQHGVAATHLPYHVEKGGIYLKDAAVIAGLGVIGRNNLLLTPRHGARVRLRALALTEALPSTGPCSFDPCAGCAAPCHSACPQSAFRQGEEAGPAGVGGAPRGAAETGPAGLGAAGGFSRQACFAQMDADVAAAVGGVIRYCRACEFACPAALVAARSPNCD